MSTAGISCLHCNSEEIRTQRIPLANGGHHVKASCASCGRFIKFLPHDSLRFYFGRYRGLTIVEIARNDLSYLEWCLSENVLRDKRLRDAVEAVVGTA